MKKKLLGGRYRFVFTVLGFCALIVGVLSFTERGNVAGSDAENGTLEKMIVASGSVTMDVDLGRLNGTGLRSGSGPLKFDAVNDTFFTVMVFNGEFRGAVPSSMELVPQKAPGLPAKLRESYERLVIESTPLSEYELAVRDAETGFVFFNVQGHEYGYNPEGRLFTIKGGRLLLSADFAAELGRPGEAGAVVGKLSVAATLKPIEVAKIYNGNVESTSMPALGEDDAGGNPGPDVIVGDVYGLAQFGSADGSYVGLAVGTNSCNAGTIDLNWFALPNNDHPVIPQNLYKMSGGATNDERFEQIGQSNVKHAFTALTQNLCGFGCNGVGGSRLGSGCSDPYSASLNAGPSLGSRAWINPFTGFFPRGDSATPPNNHSGHVHTGPSHRILTPINDLNTSSNQGAKYYAEAQYVTPHEYAWCQSNPGQCNMYNNVSYRRYTVSGTTSPFSFSPAEGTVRMMPAVSAWPGATLVEFRPDPGNDGMGFIAYKVTNPSPGVWHYEYAVFNQNLDRAIQMLSIPAGTGVSISNIGFHAPPQHPGWTNDGTAGNSGYSNTPWTSDHSNGAMTWSTETFAQNQNANAIRWGTMYNFRFDSNRPPEVTNATIGFFKTGQPIVVQVQGPSAGAVAAVTVSGRVATAEGLAIPYAKVTITDGSGFFKTVQTNSFGNYTFYSIAPGQSYTVSVAAKGYSFTPQAVQVNGNVTGLNFTASGSNIFESLFKR